MVSPLLCRRCVLFTLQNSLLNHWSRHAIVCLSALLWGSSPNNRRTAEAELTALKDELVKLNATLTETSQTNPVPARSLNSTEFAVFTAEIQELKSIMNASNSGGEGQWSHVVKRGRKLHAPKLVSTKKSLAGTEQASLNKHRWHGVESLPKRRRVNVPTARSSAQWAYNSHSSNNPLGAKQARKPLNVVRRIWGTLRACTNA